MNKLVDEIKRNSDTYGSIPFWSWNDRLEEGELRRQIRNMYDLNMRGFFMHARGGLETEYLSDDWYNCVSTCIEEARALGMEAWAYDENGWPSGFAGGRLLEDPDNFAVFVEGIFSEEFPVQNENTVCIYAFGADGTPHPTRNAVKGCSKYLSVNMGTDSSYVDTMREDITEKFIKATHEEYRKRFGEDLGKVMPGFFTDEPQYYRWKTPFSRCMDRWFLEEYGYSVTETLPALFCQYEGAEIYRYDYWRLASKRFTESYSKKIYDWAEQYGVKITGHFIEERSLMGQMRCCGEIMTQYLYEHIPGIDYLGRRLQSDISSKQLGSVCAQTGRKKALSEMFAMCGWDVTPRELKHIAELQYAGGVNVMCQHLYPYSIRGQRKRDYPAFYSEHCLWQGALREFSRYFNNLGYMLSMGSEYADTLVIHPIHSAWLWFIRERQKDCINTLEDDFGELVSLLSGNQIAYHFGSETIMASLAEVKGATISVGLCSYRRVIVPACDTLDSTTVDLLRRFKENGGSIYTYKHHIPTRIDGRIGDLSFLSDCEDISEEAVFELLRSEGDVVIHHVDGVSVEDIRMMVRNTEYGRLIYITNLSDKEFYGLSVCVKNCARLAKLDISTLDVSAVRGSLVDGGAEILLDLLGSEAVVLCEYEAPDFTPPLPSSKFECISLEGEFMPDELPDNMLTLDRAYLSLDGGAFSDLRPIERIRDELLSSRFNGMITLSFPFDVKELPSRLEVITEPMGMDTLRINGVYVNIGNGVAIDRSFRVTDIAPYVKVGENRIDVTLNYWQRDYVYYVLYGGVSESLRNCLVFDTEIECLYLRGSFALDMKKEDFISEERNAYRYDASKGMAMIGQKATVDIRNLVTDGYPFYCGEFTATTKLIYKKGDPTVLHLVGRFATARVKVNGAEAGSVLFSEYVDLGNLLREGENTLTVTLYNSYRNLLGPHHRKEAEPVSVSPVTFSFEKRWKDGECDEYDPRYSFIRYGIDM